MAQPLFEYFVGLLMKCLIHCPSSPILRVVNGKSICWLVQKTVKTGKANWAKPQVRSKNDSLRAYSFKAGTKIGRGVVFLTSPLLASLFSGCINTEVRPLVQCANVRSFRVPQCLPNCLEH